MPKFWLKFWFCCLALLIFIGSWWFLFNQNYDNLSAQVPQESEFYIFLDKTKLDDLNQSKTQDLLNFLSDNSTTEPYHWSEFLKVSDKKIGFFSLNDQIFSISPQNRPALTFLGNNDLPYSQNNGFLYFPEFNYGNYPLNLDKTEQFKDLNPKIFVNDFNAYILRPKKLAFVPFAKRLNSNPLLIKGHIKDNLIKADINIQESIFSKNPLPKPKIQDDYKFALYNVAFSGEKKAEHSLKNLAFHIIKNLDQPVNLVQYANNFTLTLENQGNLQQIKQIIKKSLSFIYPSQVKKYLPDQTPAIHKIADPEKWSFDIQNNLHTLIDQENNFQVKLTANKKTISVEFSKQIKSNHPKNNINEKIQNSFNKCLLKNRIFSQPYISINLNKELKANNFKVLNIIEKTSSNIRLCIE